MYIVYVLVLGWITGELSTGYQAHPYVYLYRYITVFRIRADPGILTKLDPDPDLCECQIRIRILNVKKNVPFFSNSTYFFLDFDAALT